MLIQKYNDLFRYTIHYQIHRNRSLFFRTVFVSIPFEWNFNSKRIENWISTESSIVTFIELSFRDWVFFLIVIMSISKPPFLCLFFKLKLLRLLNCVIEIVQCQILKMIRICEFKVNTKDERRKAKNLFISLGDANICWILPKRNFIMIRRQINSAEKLWHFVNGKKNVAVSFSTTQTEARWYCGLFLIDMHSDGRAPIKMIHVTDNNSVNWRF